MLSVIIEVTKSIYQRGKVARYANAAVGPNLLISTALCYVEDLLLLFIDSVCLSVCH